MYSDYFSRTVGAGADIQFVNKTYAHFNGTKIVIDSNINKMSP